MAKTTYRQRRLKRRMYSARRRKKSRIKSRSRSRRSRSVTSSLAKQVFNKRKPRLPGIGKCRVQRGPSRGRDNARPYRARRGRGRGRGNVRSPNSSSSGPSKSTPEAEYTPPPLPTEGGFLATCLDPVMSLFRLLAYWAILPGLWTLCCGATLLYNLGSLLFTRREHDFVKDPSLAGRAKTLLITAHRGFLWLVGTIIYGAIALLCMAGFLPAVPLVGAIALLCMAGFLPAAPLVIWYCVSSGLVKMALLQSIWAVASFEEFVVDSAILVVLVVVIALIRIPGMLWDGACKLVIALIQTPGMFWNGACKLWDHRTEIRDDIFHHIVQEYFEFVYNDERHLAPNALGPGLGGIRTFLRLFCRYNGPHFVVNPCGRARPNEQEVDVVVTEVPLESADDDELN